MKRVLLGALGAAIVVLYPVAIYLGLSRFSVRAVAPVVFGLALVGLMLRLKGKKRQHLGAILPAPLSVLLLVALSALLNEERFMLATPALISLALLVSFASSLRGPISMIGRFALLQNPELPEDHLRYCRSVTVVWCLFFVVNGLLAAALALRAPIEWWTAYNGLIAYALMGLVGALEYIFRKYRFREYGSGLHDRILRFFFPPGAP